MKLSRTNGSKADQESVAETPEARARRGSAEFLPSFVALQSAVDDACAEQSSWQARLAAGIGAVLEFASKDPEAARALTLAARRERTPFGNREHEVLSYFVDRLRKSAPTEERGPISTDEGVIEAIGLAVRGHLLSGRAAQLPALAPDLTYLALMPYTGAREAQRWAQSLSVEQAN